MCPVSLLEKITLVIAGKHYRKKELCILGDFNLNFYQNHNHRGCKNNTLVSATVFNDVKNYLQFCSMFGLTQIMKSPARITQSSTLLVDHILASLHESISKEGVINVGSSNHQLIYCIRKISRIRTRDAHKKTKFCSLKNYALMLN